MLDRISRDKLAETLRQYVSGRIKNYTLDDLNINNEDFGVTVNAEYDKSKHLLYGPIAYSIVKKTNKYEESQ